MARRTPIYGLDLVRFAAAMLVLFYHFGYKAFAVASNPIRVAIGAEPALPTWWAGAWWGWIGVQVFFVISGLVITYSAAGATPGRFLTGRIARLLPTMLIVASIAAAVDITYYGMAFSHVALLWAKSVVFWPFGPWIAGQIWTLPIEIFFYAAVYILILVQRIHRLEWLAWGIGLASAGYWIAVAGFGVIDHAGRITQLLLLQHGCYFALGMIMARLDGARLTLDRATLVLVCLATAVLQVRAAALAEAPGFGIEGEWGIAYVAWIAAIAAIGVALVTKDRIAGHIGPLAGPLRWMGLMTYPLYLVHIHAGGPVLVEALHWGLSPVLAMALAAVVSLVLAGVLASLVEPSVHRAVSAILTRLTGLLVRIGNTPVLRALKARGALTALTGVLSRASNQIVTFALTLVAMRFLDPTQFGIFSLAAIAVTVIRTLLYSGAFEHLLKAPSAREGSTETLAINLSLVTMLSAVVAAGALTAHMLGGGSQVAMLLLMLLPSNFIAAVAAWQESLLLRSTRVRQYYATTFMAELASMVVAIGLFLAGYGVLALVGQVYVRNILALAMYLLISKTEWSDDFSFSRLKSVMAWSTTRYGSVLLTLASQYAADLFLGIFLSPAATGLYRASSRLVTAVADMFNQPTRLIGMTMVSARAKRGEGSADLWPLVFVVAASVGWSALAGLAAAAATIVPVTLGDQWRDAAPVVAILCLARALTLLDAATTPALVAYNHQRPLFYFQVCAAAVLLLLVATLAPYGILPATLATVVAACVNSAMIFNLALKRLPGSAATMRRHVVVAILPALATVAGALAVQALVQSTALPGVARVALVVVGGAIAWVAALALLHRKLERLIAALRGESERDARPSVPRPA